jgi:FMN phosphatase YigB (HAD superfamily)
LVQGTAGCDIRGVRTMLKKQKIIFLDIDGVLVNHESLRRRKSPTYARASPACVSALNHILEQTGAVIVVTSTWRAHGFNKLNRIFEEEWHIKKSIFGFTPDLTQKRGILFTGVERGEEIQKWLDENQNIVGTFVILDDDNDMKHLLPHLVRTTGRTGLLFTDAYRAVEMLNESC